MEATTADLIKTAALSEEARKIFGRFLIEPARRLDTYGVKVSSFDIMTRTFLEWMAEKGYQFKNIKLVDDEMIAFFAKGM